MRIEIKNRNEVVEALEVHLTRPSDDTAFPEIVDAGQTYVIAEPNAEFCISMFLKTAPSELGQVHRGTVKGQGADGRPIPGTPPVPYNAFSVSATVDGKKLGVNKVLARMGKTVRFFGWSDGLDAQGARRYRSFKLTTPKVVGEGAGSGSGGDAMRARDAEITLEVYLALRSSDKQDRKGAVHDVRNLPTGDAVMVSEGKKFWKQSSLQTGASDNVTKRGVPLASVTYGPLVARATLHYETAATLQLRGVLKADNPRHAPFMVAHPRRDRDDGGSGSGRGSGSGSGSGQIDDGAGAGTGTKRRKEDADVEVSCDLTDDGGGAVWRETKKVRAEKPVVAVEDDA